MSTFINANRKKNSRAISVEEIVEGMAPQAPKRPITGAELFSILQSAVPQSSRSS